MSSDFWNILGIDPVNDLKTIKRAYAKKLKTTNPEDHPDAFQQLRAAYELAVKYAKQSNTQRKRYNYQMPYARYSVNQHESPLIDAKRARRLAGRIFGLAAVFGEHKAIHRFNRVMTLSVLQEARNKTVLERAYAELCSNDWNINYYHLVSAIADYFQWYYDARVVARHGMNDFVIKINMARARCYLNSLLEAKGKEKKTIKKAAEYLTQLKPTQSLRRYARRKKNITTVSRLLKELDVKYPMAYKQIVPQRNYQWWMEQLKKKKGIRIPSSIFRILFPLFLIAFAAHNFLLAFNEISRHPITKSTPIVRDPLGNTITYAHCPTHFIQDKHGYWYAQRSSPWKWRSPSPTSHAIHFTGKDFYNAAFFPDFDQIGCYYKNANGQSMSLISHTYKKVSIDKNSPIPWLYSKKYDTFYCNNAGIVNSSECQFEFK